MILIITFSLFKAARATGGEKRGKYCDAWQAKQHLFLLIKTLTSENSAVVFFFAHSFAVTIRKTYNYSAFVFATALFLCTPHCPRFTFNSPLTSPPHQKREWRSIYTFGLMHAYIFFYVCACVSIFASDAAWCRGGGGWCQGGVEGFWGRWWWGVTALLGLTILSVAWSVAMSRVLMPG